MSRLGALAAGAALLTAMVSCGGHERAPLPNAPLWPDIRQDPPEMPIIVGHYTGRRIEYRLAFGSSVTNVGSGPLVVFAHRSSSRQPSMQVDQVVATHQGSTRLIKKVGVARYARGPRFLRGSHNHWHFLPFARFELRRLDGRPVAHGRKVGFCIAGLRFPNPAAMARICAHNRPGALSVREEIKPGFVDSYAPSIEGQYISLDGVPPGVYDLVHSVNDSRRLRESDYGNNAASARIRIGTVGRGIPTVRMVRVCHQASC